MIGIRRLDPQFRAQQITGILQWIECDGAITGGLRLQEPPETAFAAGEVVPEPRRLGTRLSSPPIQTVGTSVLTQAQRHKRKTVVSVRYTGFEALRPCNA